MDSGRNRLVSKYTFEEKVVIYEKGLLLSFSCISHPKHRISHPHITNLLQRYDIIKEWICISKNQRKVGGHYEDSGL